MAVLLSCFCCFSNGFVCSMIFSLSRSVTCLFISRTSVSNSSLSTFMVF